MDVLWYWKTDENIAEVYRIHTGEAEVYQYRIYDQWDNRFGQRVRGAEIKRDIALTLPLAKAQILAEMK